MKLLVCRTLIEPQETIVESSKNDGTFYWHIPGTVFSDGICGCPGFSYRGYCRHVTESNQNRCRWHNTHLRQDLPICPNCGSSTIIFDLGSERVQPR